MSVSIRHNASIIFDYYYYPRRQRLRQLLVWKLVLKILSDNISFFFSSSFYSDAKTVSFLYLFSWKKIVPLYTHFLDIGKLILPNDFFCYFLPLPFFSFRRRTNVYQHPIFLCNAMPIIIKTKLFLATLLWYIFVRKKIKEQNTILLSMDSDVDRQKTFHFFCEREQDIRINVTMIFNAKITIYQPNYFEGKQDRFLALGYHF